uniref:Uncharacterized protein n=1 Tax=Amphimedon queenslandica TaxID=400682 RepID=A0A1X7TY16_AMPQE
NSLRKRMIMKFYILIVLLCSALTQSKPLAKRSSCSSDVDRLYNALHATMCITHSRDFQENVNDSIQAALKLINNEKELKSIKRILEGALDQDQVTDGIARAEHKVFASAVKARMSLDDYEKPGSCFTPWIKSLISNN